MNGFATLPRVWSYLIVTTFFLSFSHPLLGKGPLANIDADSKFIVYYGDDYYTRDAAHNKVVNQALINDLRRFDVVVLQPNQPNFTPEIVAKLKESRNGGADPGVAYVFGYISIGEDFLALGTAPWVSPRPEDNTGPRVLRDGRLVPSHPEGGGPMASYYIDVETQRWNTTDCAAPYLEVERDCGTRTCTNPDLVLATCNPLEDNVADLNTNFLGYMVYPDDLWLEMLKTMRIGGGAPFSDRVTKAGLLQIVGDRPADANLLTDRTQNFGMDGFFFDTIDTAGPYQDINWYPWTQAAMKTLIKNIAEDPDFADDKIFANRGGFYFQAGLQSPATGAFPIDDSIAPYINAFLFESYLYDSAPGTNEGPLGESEFYTDNRLVQLPKILAEAARPEGFTVFTLEYDSGRATTYGEAVPDAVIAQTRAAFGATTYLADDGNLNTVNLTMVNALDQVVAQDTEAPVWNSTARLYLTGDGAVDEAVRVGAQAAVAGDAAGTAIIRWDVAQDASLPVQYVLYYGTADTISTAQSRVLDAADIDRGEGYNHNPRNAFPYQTTVSELGDGTWYFWIRARDAHGHEDTNTNVQRLTLGAVPSHPTRRIVLDGDLSEWADFTGFIGDSADIDHPVAGAQIDLLDLRFAHDAERLFVAYELESFTTFNTWGFNLYLDTDNDLSTGFTNYGNFAIGADYLVQSGSLYRRENEAWVATGADVQVGTDPHVELSLPLAALGNPAELRAVFVGNSIALPNGVDATDYVPDGAAAAAGGNAFQSYSTAAVTNPVAAGAITVGDGSAADFAPLTAFPEDADDINLPAGQAENIDWRSVTTAHDPNNLYFLYEAYGLIQVDYFLQVFIDTDGDRTTGYSGISDAFPLGAEYMIEGQWLYRFDSDDQSQWSGAWTWLGTVGYSWFSNYGEIFIPRPWMNNPTRLQMFFKGRNNDGTGVVEDLYPDRALSPEAARFEYVLD
ncbi:hypothetical protein [Acanthopleuribacter pedis]|uniref:Uncharacterized protein n=1 Tax=Acanthopleuribacter pedis TaxID=442870 RepID=A0A8J7Q9A4_9BACT|nr:hypothetical protein [Acanthopleuribacter pedis]MBO1320986.1 hypothetical protein [Acanthopleuribacter pedis]